jgi:hypothetical protein
MKKISTILIIYTSVIWFNIYGNESTTSVFSNLKKNPNHIYFGPEIFAFDLDTHFSDVRVHGTKFFLGLRLGYERLKPQAFYFGIDIMAAGGNHGFHESFKGYHIPQSGGGMGFANLDLRFGYTFVIHRWLATPYLNYGAYAFGSGCHDHHFDGGMTYLGGGVRSRYEISQIFNIGLNAEIFASIYTDEKLRIFKLKRSNHRGQWGGEIGLPLIWYVGSHKRWDIQLEPYFLKLDFAEVQNIYGLRLLFGYHF